MTATSRSDDDSRRSAGAAAPLPADAPINILHPLTAELRIGDWFRVEGEYATNPVTGEQADHLLWFVATRTLRVGDYVDSESVIPLRHAGWSEPVITR